MVFKARFSDIIEAHLGINVSNLVTSIITRHVAAGLLSQPSATPLQITAKPREDDNVAYILHRKGCYENRFWQ